MEWFSITGNREVSTKCVSLVDWNLIVQEQTAYQLSGITLVNASLFGETLPEPNEPPNPTYLARLALAQSLVTGITWYEAALWCNALSSSLGLEPVYQLNGVTAMWVPPISTSGGKDNLTEYKRAPGAKGVSLLTENTYKAVGDDPSFIKVSGVHEWGDDRRRAPQVFESFVFTGTDTLLCSSTFKLGHNSFRVVKG